MTTKNVNDVSPESSTGVVEVTPDTESGSSPVTTDDNSGVPTDRPLHNLKAELDRKLGRVEERFSGLEQLLTNVLTVVSGTKAGGDASTSNDKEYTDEELLELWQGGSKAAGDMLLERKLDRRERAKAQTDRETNFIQSQLQNLFVRYPILRDGNHPLTKAAMATRTVLLRTGAEPGSAVDLESIKIAIADNPGLAAEAIRVPGDSPSREEARTSATDSTMTSFGVSPRKSSGTKANQSPQLSEASVKLAKRMGVKDPVAAIGRMKKRWENRTSAISPLLINSLGVEE